MIPFGHVGIAMGSSIAAWYNVGLLNKYAENCGDFKIFTKTKHCIYKIGVSAFVMMLVLFLSNYFCQDLYYSDNLFKGTQKYYLVLLPACLYNSS